MRCSACGNPMRLAEPERRLGRRIARWFNDGRLPSGQQSYRCDVCGMGASVSAVYADTRWRRASLSGIYDRRTMQPVPRFYALMAAAGTVVGLGWSALLSWPWWLGPTVAVVGGWLFMTSTAFWHPRLPRRRQARQ